MLLEINGKMRNSLCQTTFEAKAQYGSEADVLIINGFQIEEDCRLSENDVLTLIRKGAMPDQSEFECMMMARHSPGVHKKIKESRVAIAGLGGLGSNIAVMLARIGVGHLLLIDFDIVEPSNLNRQSYYIRHLGMLKTAALLNQLKEINPFINIEIQNIRVTEENVVDLFKGYPIVCEAFDKPEAKSMLVNVILEQLPDTRIVSSSGMAGYVSSNSIRTTRPMKCLYVCGDLENEARIGNGLMAPRVQICAGHQANMVLRLLLDLEDI